MKLTSSLPHGFRLVAGIALCGIAASLPVASHAAAPAARFKAEPAPVPAMSEETAMETAERVRARAIFSASVAPGAASAIAAFPEQARAARLTPEGITRTMWLLRSDPGLVKKWQRLLAAPGPEKEKETQFRAFAELPHELRAVAKGIDRAGRNEPRGNALKANPKQADMPQPGPGWIAARDILDRQAFEDGVMITAVAIRKALALENVSVEAAMPYLDALVKLQDNPDDLRLGASLVKAADLDMPERAALIAKLAASPAKARPQITNLPETTALQNRFAFAMREEGARDVIKMPLEAVLPDAVRPVRKPKDIPLATYWMRPNHISFKRLDRLFPERPKPGDALSFLLPGERLYAVGGGISVYEGTPLDPLSISGPAVFEYDPARFAPGEVFPAGSGNTRPFFIAALCGPEDLAKHLASLSVMLTAREKSLYGPFPDFTWSPEDTPWAWRHKRLAVLPKDAPGKTLRLVDVTDPDLFLAFAPNADKPGLARLMGPIRGVWVKDNADRELPWTEMRYDPGRRGPKKPSVLGESPVLSVDGEALAAIVALKERDMLHEWAAYALRTECGPDANSPECRKLWTSVLAGMRKTFADMAAKGVVSPWDKGGMVYIMERHVKNPELQTTLKAMRDDRSQSSAKRRRAMEAAGNAAAKQ